MNFLWWPSTCKKTKTSIDCVQSYWLTINESWNPTGEEAQLTKNKPKVVHPDATFPWWLTPCKKWRFWLISSRDIDDKRLVETTLSHNSRNRFSQIYNFRRIMENIVMHYFEGKKKHQWINLFGKSQENYFGRIFGFFSKLGISRKIRFCLFLTT